MTLSLLAVAVVRADPPPPPDYLLAVGGSTQVGELPPADGGTVPPPVAVDPTEGAPTTSTTAAPTTTAAPGPATTAAPATVPPPPPGPVPVDVGRVTAVGDSVMAGAANAVYVQFANKAFVDAAVNRQVGTGIEILTAWRDAGLLGDVVIVHLGNNGTFSDAQFDQMMSVLGGVGRVVFVTVKVPRGWEESVNATLTNGVARYPNTILVDWRAYSLPHPEWFYDDAIHLRPEGAAAYADLIASYLVP